MAGELEAMIGMLSNSIHPDANAEAVRRAAALLRQIESERADARMLLRVFMLSEDEPQFVVGRVNNGRWFFRRDWHDKGETEWTLECDADDQDIPILTADLRAHFEQEFRRAAALSVQGKGEAG